MAQGTKQNEQNINSKLCVGRWMKEVKQVRRGKSQDKDANGNKRKS